MQRWLTLINHGAPFASIPGQPWIQLRDCRALTSIGPVLGSNNGDHTNASRPQGWMFRQQPAIEIIEDITQKELLSLYPARVVSMLSFPTGNELLGKDHQAEKLS